MNHYILDLVSTNIDLFFFSVARETHLPYWVRMIHARESLWKQRGTRDGSLSALSVAGGDVMCEYIFCTELQSEVPHLCESAAWITLYSGQSESTPDLESDN